MTTFENIEMNVEDLDLTLRCKVVQRIKRAIIAVYGRIKVSEEEFQLVCGGMGETIKECVCEFYGMSEDEIEVPYDAEEWYDAYRKYYG